MKRKGEKVKRSLINTQSKACGIVQCDVVVRKNEEMKFHLCPLMNRINIMTCESIFNTALRKYESSGYIRNIHGSDYCHFDLQ